MPNRRNTRCDSLSIVDVTVIFIALWALTVLYDVHRALP